MVPFYSRLGKCYNCSSAACPGNSCYGSGYYQGTASIPTNCCPAAPGNIPVEKPLVEKKKRDKEYWRPKFERELAPRR